MLYLANCLNRSTSISWLLLHRDCQQRHYKTCYMHSKFLLVITKGRYWPSIRIKNMKQKQMANKTNYGGTPAVAAVSSASWSFYPEPLQHSEIIFKQNRMTFHLQNRIEFLRWQAPSWRRGVFWWWLQRTHVCCCASVRLETQTESAKRASLACLKHELQHNQMKEPIQLCPTSLQDGFRPICRAADGRVGINFRIRKCFERPGQYLGTEKRLAWITSHLNNCIVDCDEHKCAKWDHYSSRNFKLSKVWLNLPVVVNCRRVSVATSNW